MFDRKELIKLRERAEDEAERILKSASWRMNNQLDKIICADCIPTMDEMPDELVDLIVTSPGLAMAYGY